MTRNRFQHGIRSGVGFVISATAAFAAAQLGSASIGASNATLDQVTPPSVASYSGAWSFAGSAPAGADVVVVILTSPATGPLPGPLTARPVVADGTGHWAQSVTQMTSPAGNYSFAAYALDARGRASLPSSTAAITVSAATATDQSVPVVPNATITGQIGVPIGPLQISATGAPTSFSAPELGAYGLAINDAGIISGTPTMSISTIVEVTAENMSGTSFPAELTVTIAPGSPASAASATSPSPRIAGARGGLHCHAARFNIHASG